MPRAAPRVPLSRCRDWEAQQEALEAVRRFRADAPSLSRAAGAQLADELALCLTARILVALQQTPSAEEDPAAQLERLRQWGVDLARLRKGDHNAEWLRIERGKLDLHLKKYEDETAERKKCNDPFRKHREGGVSKETLDQLAKDLRLF